jgi:hypothetical protein
LERKSGVHVTRLAVQEVAKCWVVTSKALLKQTLILPHRRDAPHEHKGFSIAGGRSYASQLATNIAASLSSRSLALVYQLVEEVE